MDSATTPGLRATLLTLRFDPDSQEFDTSALAALCEQHDVLTAHEHIVPMADGPPVFAVFVTLRRRSGAPAREVETRPRSVLQSVPTAQRTDSPIPAPPQQQRTRHRGEDLVIDSSAQPLYERLCAWRTRTAHDLGVPAYVVLRNSVLADIATRQPTTLGALRSIPGIGPATADRHGEALINLVIQAEPTPGEAS